MKKLTMSIFALWGLLCILTTQQAEGHGEYAGTVEERDFTYKGCCSGYICTSETKYEYKRYAKYKYWIDDDIWFYHWHVFGPYTKCVRKWDPLHYAWCTRYEHREGECNWEYYSSCYEPHGGCDHYEGDDDYDVRCDDDDEGWCEVWECGPVECI